MGRIVPDYFFALLPIWKESLRGLRLDMILSNLSGALNLPVNMVGAEALMKQYEQTRYRFFDWMRGKCGNLTKD